MTRTRAFILGALVCVLGIGLWSSLRPVETGDLCQSTGALAQRSDYASMAAQAFLQTAWAGDDANVVRVVAGDLNVPAAGLSFPGHFAEISDGDILHLSPFEEDIGDSLVQLRSAEVAAQLQFDPCGGMTFQQWYAPRDDEVFDWPQPPLGE